MADVWSFSVAEFTLLLDLPEEMMDMEREEEDSAGKFVGALTFSQSFLFCFVLFGSKTERFV